MKIISILFALIFSTLINAQTKSGIIKYDMVSNFVNAKANALAEGVVPEALLAMFPKEVKRLKQLTFTETKSLFENVKKVEDENGEVEPNDPNGAASFGFKQIGTSANITDRIFIDLINDEKIERQTFYDKSFIIKTDSLKKKIVGNLQENKN